MQPPEGIWGMPPGLLKTLPGYDPDMQKTAAPARPRQGRRFAFSALMTAHFPGKGVMGAVRRELTN
jgi:hypothetical protein